MANCVYKWCIDVSSVTRATRVYARMAEKLGSGPTNPTVGESNWLASRERSTCMNTLMQGTGRCLNHHSDGALMIERHPRRACRMTENMHEKAACIEQIGVRMDGSMAQRKAKLYPRRACLRTRVG